MSSESQPHILLQKQMQEIIENQFREIEHLKLLVKEREGWVSLENYGALVKEFQEEKDAHQQTKAELFETQDRLDFAQGEIEVLTKQLQREKAQFEQTFGTLKNKALRETVKNVELENKCNVIQQEVQHKSHTLNHREQVIEDLSQQLQKTEASYKKQLCELNIQMQQDMYIKEIMQGHERKGSVASKGRQRAQLSGKK